MSEKKQGNRERATGSGEEGRENCRVIVPKRVPLIYIAGPYRPTKRQKRELQAADETYDARLLNLRNANILAAHEAGREVVEAGGMPLTPHKCTERFDGLIPDDEFIARDLGTYLPVCDALWAIDGWRESAGAIEEVREAIRLGKPLILSVETMREFCGLWRDGLMAKGHSDRFIFTHRELSNMIATRFPNITGNGQATLDGSDSSAPGACAPGSEKNESEGA